MLTLQLEGLRLIKDQIIQPYTQVVCAETQRIFEEERAKRAKLMDNYAEQLSLLCTHNKLIKLVKGRHRDPWVGFRDNKLHICHVPPSMKVCEGAWIIGFVNKKLDRVNHVTVLELVPSILWEDICV